jgi:hypothetical protein
MEKPERNHFMSKITVATLKSFVRKHEGNIYLAVNSDFDGMTDCVERCSGLFKPARKSEINASNNLGYNGMWLVGSSRDRVAAYDKDGMKGFEVNNCCGNWIVAVRDLPNDDRPGSAAAFLREETGIDYNQCLTMTNCD